MVFFKMGTIFLSRIIFLTCLMSNLLVFHIITIILKSKIYVMVKFNTLIAAFLLLVNISISAQEQGFQFKMVKEINTSPVKNQQRTGTCWSFATTSFVETELVRMGKPVFDISEMFFVRHAYASKARNYVRYQGNNNFGQGGQAHDVMDVIKTYGMVTEQEYSGLNYGTDVHAHSELAAVLNAYLDAVVKNPNKALTTAWYPAYNSILDNYLGVAPDAKKSTLANVGFNPDDYVEITSYSHHPFYFQFVLEIPDNWSHSLYYNVPLDDLIKTIKNALMNGYSVCWDGDVSEKSFAWSKGVAVLPVEKVEEIAGSDKDRWVGMTDKERKAKLTSFEAPVPEIMVDQSKRQFTFDNYTSSDDHLMHLTGLATDQNGTTYFYTKNSWGTDGVYNGYLYMSEPFVRMKTIAILVHKKALPEEVAKKLGIK